MPSIHPHCPRRARCAHFSFCTLVLLATLVLLSPAFGETLTGNLPRGAVLGFQVETVGDGALRVREVEEDSPVAASGLRAGDLLVTIGSYGSARP